MCTWWWSVELARVIKAQATVRKKVASELLDTERSYVTSMRNMARLLIQPIQDSTKRGVMILTEKEQFDIFANVLELLEGHEVLLEALSNRLENWTEQTIVGDLLIEHVRGDLRPCLSWMNGTRTHTIGIQGGFFPRYGPYMENYNISLIALYYQMKKNERFKEMVEVR